MTTHIPPSAMPLISPPALLRAYLNQTPPTRPSRRSPHQSRTIELNTSSLTHCNGSSLVRIGATSVVCGVRAEVLPVSDIPSFRVKKSANPSPTTNNHENADESELALYNLLVPNMSLSTGCSPMHPANTAPSIEAQSLSQRLLSLLLTSHLIRLSDLEIRHTPNPDSLETSPGPADSPSEITSELKAYWTLYIDILCISHAGSGSVFDTAWLALYAALRDTMLPHAYYDIDDAIIYCSPDVKNARALELRGFPVPTSFGVFDMGSTSGSDAVANHDSGKEVGARVLVDLDSMEEDCVSEKGCVVIDTSNADAEPTILRLEKWGGASMPMDGLREVLQVAGERWREWRRVLETETETEAVSQVSSVTKDAGFESLAEVYEK